MNIPARAKQTPPVVTRPNAQAKLLDSEAKIMMAIRMQAPVPNNAMTLKTAMHLLPEHLPTQMNIPMSTKQAIDPINPKHSKVFVAVNQSPNPNLTSVSTELQESVILIQYCHNPLLNAILSDQ